MTVSPSAAEVDGAAARQDLAERGLRRQEPRARLAGRGLPSHGRGCRLDALTIVCMGKH